MTLLSMSSRSYGVRKVMSSIPVGDSDFSLSNACVNFALYLTNFIFRDCGVRPSALFQQRIFLLLLYIELSNSFLVGRKLTVNFRNQRP